MGEVEIDGERVRESQKRRKGRKRERDKKGEKRIFINFTFI